MAILGQLVAIYCCRGGWWKKCQFTGTAEDSCVFIITRQHNPRWSPGSHICQQLSCRESVLNFLFKRKWKLKRESFKNRELICRFSELNKRNSWPLWMLQRFLAACTEGTLSFYLGSRWFCTSFTFLKERYLCSPPKKTQIHSNSFLQICICTEFFSSTLLLTKPHILTQFHCRTSWANQNYIICTPDRGKV